MKRTLIGTLAAMGAVAALVAAPTIATGNETVAPITMDHDCESGMVSWEYRNDHAAPVTMTKQRLVLPPELGFNIDTTLSYWDIELDTGQSFGLTITGIIYIDEGEIPGNDDLTAVPDGEYVNHVWLTDGVTNWFVKQVVQRDCGVEAIPGAATFGVGN